MALDVKSLNLIQQIDPGAMVRNPKSVHGHKDEGQLFGELALAGVGIVNDRHRLLDIIGEVKQIQVLNINVAELLEHS